MFALYSDHPQRAEAEQAGRQVIEMFLKDAANWMEHYRSSGAADTASREAFSQEVARRLGITRLLPNVTPHRRETRRGSRVRVKAMVGRLLF